MIKNIPTGDTARKLACYNGETIVPKGRLIITIESGGWKVQSAPFIVVDDKKANRYQLVPQIGIKLIQEQNTEKVHAIREQEESDSAKKTGQRQLHTIVCTHRKVQKSHDENTVHRRFRSDTTEGPTHSDTFTRTCGMRTEQTN